MGTIWCLNCSLYLKGTKTIVTIALLGQWKDTLSATILKVMLFSVAEKPFPLINIVPSGKVEG